MLVQRNGMWYESLVGWKMVLEDGECKFAYGIWKLQDRRWKMVEGVRRDGGRSMEGWIKEYVEYCTKIRKTIKTHMEIILEHNFIK